MIFVFLIDADFEKVLYAEKLIDEIDEKKHAENESGNIDALTDKLNETIKILENSVTDRINEEFNILNDEKYSKEYFFDMWDDILNSDACYVDENYIVYENIVKCYA